MSGTLECTRNNLESLKSKNYLRYLNSSVNMQKFPLPVVHAMHMNIHTGIDPLTPTKPCLLSPSSHSLHEGLYAILIF